MNRRNKIRWTCNELRWYSNRLPCCKGGEMRPQPCFISGYLSQSQGYGRLLFPNNQQQQEAKFMAALAFIVSSLKKPEAMIPAVKQLGQRHASYGVRLEHYRFLSQALFWALEQLLGDAFTPQVAEAWHDVYYLIAGLMKEAAGLKKEAVFRDSLKST